MRNHPMMKLWWQPCQHRKYSLEKEAKVMDGVRVQPGFGKRRYRVSITVIRRGETDQQRCCKHQQPRGHPSSGAGSGSQRAFCHPDRWSWSAQLGPTKSRKHYSNPLLCIRAAWVSHTGTTPELRILPHSDPCPSAHPTDTLPLPF